MICKKNLQYPEKVFCKKCLEQEKFSINNFNKKLNYIENSFYISSYENFKNILLESKMKYRKSVLKYFLNFLKSELKDVSNIESNIDYIIPVPLSLSKRIERGFNQSELIAEILFSKEKNQKNIIYKIKSTKDQKLLDADERKKNLQGAFNIKSKEIIKNKSILLIDDVITTGSTISEIGKLLLHYNAKKVNAFTLFKVYKDNYEII